MTLTKNIIFKSKSFKDDLGVHTFLKCKFFKKQTLKKVNQNILYIIYCLFEICLRFYLFLVSIKNLSLMPSIYIRIHLQSDLFQISILQ